MMFNIRIPTLSEVGRAAERTVQGIGNASRQAQGSLGYVNPFTMPYQLGSDYVNQQDNIKKAEAEAEEAQKRLDASVSAADRLRAQQGVFASNLKKNAARDYGLLSNQAAANQRRIMADQIREAKQSASSRGLLGSGFQKSQEGRARAEAKAGTATAQAKIKDLLDQQIMDAENLQAQLGLEMGGIQQSMSDQYYRMAMENMAKRNESLGDILTAGARVGGTYLGSRQRGEG